MKTFFAAAFFATALAGISSAGAMPLAPAHSSGSDVIQVAGGCGPGFHRGPMGRCRPNRGPIFGRPIVRACPPGFFVGPRGACRRRF